MDEGAEAAIQNPRAASRHIKKRSLRNKSLSISFDDKDLKDYVTGFHKRKKKRRKEAERHLQEKDRRKRIEERKKRKLERALVYGGPLPAEEAQSMNLGEGCGSGPEGDDDLEQNTSVSGTKMYDNGNTTITVTTSELSREDEALQASTFIPRLGSESEKKISLPVKRKPFKKVIKQKSRRKPKKSASQKKGKKNMSKNKR